MRVLSVTLVVLLCKQVLGEAGDSIVSHAQLAFFVIGTFTVFVQCNMKWGAPTSQPMIHSSG